MAVVLYAGRFDGYAIGDIYGEGKCIEFAKGQYVVIDDFNRLVSAFSLISE